MAAFDAPHLDVMEGGGRKGDICVVVERNGGRCFGCLCQYERATSEIPSMYVRKNYKRGTRSEVIHT